MRTVIVPHIMPDERPKNAAGWTGFGKALAAAGPSRSGMPGWQFGWHNHDFEFVATDAGDLPHRPDPGRRARVWCWSSTWPGRSWQAGPAEWIAKYGARMMAAHVKDIAPRVRTRTRTAGPMSAMAPWTGPTIMAALRKAGLHSYFVMEHDNPKITSVSPAARIAAAQSSVRAEMRHDSVSASSDAAISRPPICGWRRCSRGWKSARLRI